MQHIHNSEFWSDYRARSSTKLDYLGLVGIAALILSGLLWITTQNNQTALPAILLVVGILLILPSAILRVVLWRMLDTREGVRNRILNAIPWRGDEMVLDVGCGSGMLLNGCAKRLTTGKAVGIDIWASDSGGGTVDLLWENARSEGVADRIEVKKADARQMPFEDEAFDVVVSSWALHHMGAAAEQEQATREMLRVLKPGGTIALVDVSEIIATSERIMSQQTDIHFHRVDGRYFSFLGGTKQNRKDSE